MRSFSTKFFLFCFFLLACSNSLPAQKDITVLTADTTIRPARVIDLKKDTVKKKSSPRTAALRSAILPGLGQIYNKKYWKLPIVYAALGITGYIFIDNIKTYREYRFAYSARYKASQPPPFNDSTDYHQLKQLYKVISAESIRSARNKFRQYVDYSAIFFILFWGLNVVDAAVDAHLKPFDVSPDLSLQIKPGRSEMAGTNGISLVLNIGKRK